MNSLQYLTFCKMRYFRTTLYSLKHYSTLNTSSIFTLCRSVFRGNGIELSSLAKNKSYHNSVNFDSEYKSNLFPYPKNVLKNYFILSSETLKKNYNFTVSFYKEGKDHAPKYHCILHLNGPVREDFHGIGNTKKSAEANAATKATMRLYKGKFMNASGVPKEVLETSNRLGAPKKEVQKIWSQGIQLEIHENLMSRAEDLINEYKETIVPLLANSEREAGHSESEDRIVCMMTGRTIREEEMQQNKTRDSELLLQACRKSVSKQNYTIQDQRNEILNSIDAHPVTIIEGQTGCGKSTQVPQMILDHWAKDGKGSLCNIVVAQPRRLATLALAHWVAGELEEKVGSSVGYKMRLDEAMLKKKGGIMFYTNGSLREMIRGNPDFEGVSHVIIDEVHERSIDTDLLLLLIKRALIKGSHVKFILMSATARFNELKDYFGVSNVVQIPAGCTYPVTTRFLEDVVTEVYSSSQKQAKVLTNCSKDRNPTPNLEFISDLVRNIHGTRPEGAILVFLPGWNDIKAVKQMLSSTPELWVLPLHSRLTRAAQESIFDKGKPGVRKVILATNIAETSITVDDVVYVVDSGLQNDSRFVPKRNINTFGTVWITKANAVQRRGRAGRVSPGEVFRLYTRPTFNGMPDYPTSEMLKLPLEAVVLRCKAMFVEDARTLLRELIEPPSDLAIDRTLETLVHLRILCKEKRNTSPSLFDGHEHCVKLNEQNENSSKLNEGYVSLEPIDTGVDTNDLKERDSVFGERLSHSPEDVFNEEREFLTPLGRRLVSVSTSPVFSKALVYSAFMGYFDLASNFIGMENRSGGVFVDSVSGGRMKYLKEQYLQDPPVSDFLSLCFLLREAFGYLSSTGEESVEFTSEEEDGGCEEELELTHGSEKWEHGSDSKGSESNWNQGNFGLLEAQLGQDESEDLLKFYICQDKLNNVMQVKNLFRRQIQSFLPQFLSVQRDLYNTGDGVTDEVPDFDSLLDKNSDPNSSNSQSHELLLASFLSTANTIIRRGKRDTGRGTFLVSEDGSRVTVHGSSLFSNQLNHSENELFFSTDLFHSQSRNISIARELTSISPLAVALFYGENLEKVQSVSNETLLKISGRDVYFEVPDERTADCVLDMREMWTRLLDFFLDQESPFGADDVESKLDCDERVFQIAQVFQDFLTEILVDQRNKTI